MANEIKYVNVDWGDSTPIAGERLATNGYYTGQHKGSVTQDASEAAAELNIPYIVETTTIRCGTMLGDYADENFPAIGVGLTQTLTGCTSDTNTHAIDPSENLEIVYTADDGKALPDAIVVKVGGSTLTVSTDYTWTKATGTLEIASAKLTGDVDITVTAS